MDSKNKSQYGYICWEPEEQYRGDFARTYFFMATAYEYLDWTAYPDYISNASYLMFSDNIIQVLLDWHRSDPVSDKEICRADQISTIQHNRNPFIDYPELVEYIWGDKKGQKVNLSALTCAFKEGVCPDPVIPEPDPQKYDTLINLPAIAKGTAGAYVNGSIQGSENAAIRSNGNASITMGNGAADGVITFTGLNLDKDAILAFRASPFNSAKSMQLDIFLNDADSPIQSIQETVENETRNEVRYRVSIPKGTNKIEMVSVGGSTDKRACMQELYLLQQRKNEDVCNTPTENTSARKEIREGKVMIVRGDTRYSVLGQQIR